MIVWGKKKVERKLGFVADFCPICRKIRPFSIFRVGVTSHIYYLSFNEGEMLGHVAECQVCKTKIPVNSSRYKSISNTINNSIAKLVLQTYPDLREDYAGRLKLEERIKSHEILTTLERETLILESLKYLSGRVEEKYTKATFDKESGIGCFITVFLTLLFGCIMPIMVTAEKTQNIITIVTGLTISIGLIYTVIQLILVPRRFVRDDVIPLLAKTLQPLNPTFAEIERSLNQFKLRGFKIGIKVSKDKLWEALQKNK